MSKKRVTLKLKRPNPLFETWLNEWYKQEKEKQSNIQYAYLKALNSLKKYPLPLKTGRDCLVLQGFGEKLCGMLDNRLKQHLNGNNVNDPVQTSPPKVKRTRKKAKTPNKSQSNENYIPAYRSGPYAILLALHDNKSTAIGMTKSQIVDKARHLCDASFKAEPGSFYTAWSSMASLISKNLVVKEGKPAMFMLSEDGVKLAAKLASTAMASGDDKVVLESTSKQPVNKDIVGGNDTDKNDNTDFFQPHTFDVVLLVDSCETSGKNSSNNDEMQIELNHLGVNYEVRNLKVGDFLWICRERTSSSTTTKRELVLPYIIERKRMDDLGASIKDGRYHEQKFRLKQSSIQNLIYLVESYGNDTHIGLPISHLEQAATNTLIQDRFDVKYTKGLRHSVKYIANLHKLLNDLYQGKTLMSCPKENLSKSSLNDDLIPLMTFSEFNKSNVKSQPLSVRQTFVKQLLRLSGLSVEKALAITSVYPTPQHLHQKYLECTPSEGEKLLAPIVFGKLNKKVGPAISKTIYYLFTRDAY